MSLRVSVIGEKQLNKLADDYRRAGKRLSDLNNEVRGPTKAVGEFVREKIMTADVSGDKKPGRKPFPANVGNKLPMKHPTAMAVRWHVRVARNAQAVITFDPARMPPRIRQLFPYWTDARGRYRRLRHPLMGFDRLGRWKGAFGQRMPNVWQHALKLGRELQKTAAKACDDTAAIIGGRKR